jgi:uncharacterized protein (TIGR03032 family)
MNEPLAPFSCVYSLNIPELLMQLGCTIAITTYQAGKLLFIGAKDNNALIQLGKNMEKPMGLAFDGERLAVAGRQNVLIYSAAPILAKDYPRKPDTYDNLFLPRAQYYTSLLDIHDLVWVQSKLLMVNTRFSCLAWLDDKYTFLPVWKPKFVTELVPEDRCHLNGVALEADKPVYVSMLGKSDEVNGWRNNKASGGVIMDIESNEIVASELAMPHTPRLIDGSLYVLQSAKGELIKIDTATGRYEVIKKFNGYVRGMAYCKGYLFIGFSRIRATHNVFSNLPVSESATHAGVAVMHLATATVAGEIIYQNSVEEIYDLQIIPNMRPGMVNFDQEEKDMAISIPGNGFWGRFSE